jgi:hypothetical protein
MVDTVPGAAGEKGHAGCPFCTIQIPAEATVCPHCQMVLPPRGGGGRRAKEFGLTAGGPASARLERYGIWIRAGGGVLLALVALLLLYQRWFALTVTIVPNPSLPVRAEKERRGKAVVIRGAVTNEGDDVPDLSLRSIRVVAEIVYRNGRRDRRSAFPKSEHRGEGALLRGETGRFEFETSAHGLEQVVLRSEVVDLGLGRRLIPPRGRREPVTGR